MGLPIACASFSPLALAQVAATSLSCSDHAAGDDASTKPLAAVIAKTAGFKNRRYEWSRISKFPHGFTHGHKLFGHGRVYANGAVKHGFGGTRLHGYRKALHDLARIRAYDVPATTRSDSSSTSSFMRVRSVLSLKVCLSALKSLR